MDYETACLLIAYCNAIKTLKELGVVQMIGPLAGQMLLQDWGADDAEKIHTVSAGMIARIDDAIACIRLSHASTTGSTN
jgi:hypothetical protein